jgi:hypothetical protein
MGAWAVIASLLLGTAAPLSYAWKKGEARRYRYEETTHFHRGGETVTVRSTFSQTVRAAHRDGTAEVEIKLEALEVLLGGGRIDLGDRVPATLGATTDRRGRLVMQQTLAVSLHDGRVSVGPRAGDGDPTIDLIPCRLFDLLVLPARAPAAGRSQEVRGPAGAVRWSLARTEKSVSTIRVTTAAAGDGIRARRRMALSARATPLTPREADLTMRFDRVAGQLLEARGTVIERVPSKANSRVVLEVVRKR